MLLYLFLLEIAQRHSLHQSENNGTAAKPAVAKLRAHTVLSSACHVDCQIANFQRFDRHVVKYCPPRAQLSSTALPVFIHTVNE